MPPSEDIVLGEDTDSLFSAKYLVLKEDDKTSFEQNISGSIILIIIISLFVIFW